MSSGFDFLCDFFINLEYFFYAFCIMEKFVLYFLHQEE